MVSMVKMRGMWETVGEPLFRLDSGDNPLKWTASTAQYCLYDVIWEHPTNNLPDTPRGII